MIHLLILAVHLLAAIAKLVRPGGVRVVVAESLLIKHQLLISSRGSARRALQSPYWLRPGSNAASSRKRVQARDLPPNKTNVIR
jgi:hypothetical protein